MTNESQSYRSPPEPGQLVEVRRRRWIVSDVKGSVFSSSLNGNQHLVTLSALDEESMGEEIQVFWQIEPGARVLERAGLPTMTGWDAPERLDAFLDAVRWGAVTNADRSFLQAPFRSGVTIEDYQLDPLVRAIDMARVNLLIADDVGLGKTIEAGFVIQELLVRHRARTVFIVCPASLQIKWKTEMWEKFGLEFRIVDTAYIKQLRRERGIHANPWASFPRLVTSMDWIKSGEGFRLLKDILPPHITYPRKFDILLVDEAHNVAPATSARYALETQRTRAIRAMAPHFEHRLFLSATPHNGYQESFTSLLELLDDQRFARSVMPDEKKLRQVMVRRLKTDLLDTDGNPLFPVRELKTLEVDYSADEREAHRLLRDYTESRATVVEGTDHECGTAFIHKLLKKRLFSSPMAFAVTLAKHRASLMGKRTKVRRTGTLDDRVLISAVLKAQEEHADELIAEAAEDEVIEILSIVPLTKEQKAMLDRLASWAEKAKNKIDSKAKAILDWLGDHLKPNGVWNDKRVILFTEYRATQSWLEQILASHGYGGDRLMTIHGGIVPVEREPIKAAFQAHPEKSAVRILLATDAASEGIDLQNHCNYLIHVEIPWNPNVMEQRNGRIDRHGQKASKVSIWHPAGKGFESHWQDSGIDVGEIEGDHEFLMRAVLKVDTMREDLGSVGPVIATQIEDAMLGRGNYGFDTRIAEAKARNARKLVSAERKLQEKIERLHERLMEAKTDFHLSPNHISHAVHTALEIAGKPPLEPIHDENGKVSAIFRVPSYSGSWAHSVQGLEHPHSGERRPITFDHEVARDRDDVVLAHLNHRFVQMCLRLLREEVWKLDDIKRLHRITIKSITERGFDNPRVIVWSRLVITGGGQHRLHEEITLAGGELKAKGFTRIPQLNKLQSLLDRSTSYNPDRQVFSTLKNRFSQHEASIRAAVESRSQDRLRYLKSTLQRRKENEKRNLATILNELETAIETELEEDALPKQMVLPGFEEDERFQVRRDIDALKARLARIPEERQLEGDAIEQRYRDLVEHTFPVAIAFILPVSHSGGSRW